MTNIVERLIRGTGDGLQAYDLMQEAALEIAQLRNGLRLIVDHPVERTEQWKEGAREMQRLALQTINGRDVNLVRRMLEAVTELSCKPGACGCEMRSGGGFSTNCIHGAARAALGEKE